MNKWKDVPGFVGKYQVNNVGEVRSLERLVRGSNGVMYHKKMKTLKQTNHNCGYLMVNLHENGRMKTSYVHRLVLSAFVGDGSGFDANHKNGNKKDNRVENLEWCTRRQNIHHSIKMGLTKPQPTGVNSPHAKLCTDGAGIYSLSHASKLSGFANSYFCEMLRGKYKNKTGFKLI